MTINIELQALSSERKVHEVAKAIASLSEAVHQALRRLSLNILSSDSVTPYALLTEEYAIRARANILLVDAKRFVIQDLNIMHGELIAFLNKMESKLNEVKCLDELSELVVGLMLFSNSIVSKKERVITFLLQELKDSSRL